MTVNKQKKPGLYLSPGQRCSIRRLIILAKGFLINFKNTVFFCTMCLKKRRVAAGDFFTIPKRKGHLCFCHLNRCSGKGLLMETVCG